MERRKGIITGLVACVILLLVILTGWMVWQQKAGQQSRTYMEVPASADAKTESAQVKRESMGEKLAERESVKDGAAAAEQEGLESGANLAEQTNVESEASQANQGGMTNQGGMGVNTAGVTAEDIVLLFAGDVYLSDHVLNAYQKAGGITGVLDEGIRQEIEAADIFMVNQEFPFTDRGTAAADKQYTFRLAPEKVSMFHEMGIDIVTLANNHILDFGEVGLLDSCETLDKAGIQYVGAGENLERARQLETMTVGDKTIGFLGTSRVYMAASWAAGASHPGVFSTYDPALPLEAIKAAKEQCDYLVVYVHWGVERETTPKDYQKTMGRQYIDAGADLVVGSHPHVLQEMEIYNGKPIVYSLGNFVFGSSIPKTALLKVELSGDGGWEHGVESQAVGGESQAVEAGSQPAVKVTMIPCTSSAGYTRLAQ